MSSGKKTINNYDISENLVLNIVKGQDDKLFLSCDVYYNGIFNRVDFEIADKKLKVVYIDTNMENIEEVFYNLTANNVNVNNNELIITLDSIFKCNEDYSFYVKFNKTFNLDNISKTRYDIFDKLDNKFGLYYIKALLKSKQLYSNYDFIYENIDKILEFINITEKPRIEFFNNNQNIRYDLEEGIKVAQDFLDEMNIRININDLINDGSIIFSNGFETKFLNGQSTFDKEKNKKVIYIHQTNDLTMITVLIHELIHYYNQPTDNNRTMASEFLTEVTSYGYELIFLDRYLSGEYQSDAEDMFRWVINSLRWASFFTYAPIFSLKLYKDNKLTMEEIEKKMSLENYFNEMKDFIKSGKRISNNFWNIIGYYLAIYSYIEYKKDPFFSNKLLELNDSMNSKSFMECLKIIDLNSIDDVFTKGIINLEEYANFVNSFEKNDKVKGI